MYFTNRNQIFFKEAIDNAIEHCRYVWPEEGVGAIIDDEFVPYENEAESLINNFIITNEDFYQQYKEGNVQCLIHSHEDYPHASMNDQIQQAEMDIPFCIINFKKRSVTHVIFWGRQIPIEPFKLRPFFFGVFDCWSLVADWIKIKKSIIVPNPARKFGFWRKGESVFERFIEDECKPYKYIRNVREFKEGDILFYKIHSSKYINHSAIVHENNKALHHFHNKVSAEYPISFMQKYIECILRFDPYWNDYNNPKCLWEKI